MGVALHLLPGKDGAGLIVRACPGCPPGIHAGRLSHRLCGFCDYSNLNSLFN